MIHTVHTYIVDRSELSPRRGEGLQSRPYQPRLPLKCAEKEKAALLPGHKLYRADAVSKSAGKQVSKHADLQRSYNTTRLRTLGTVYTYIYLLKIRVAVDPALGFGWGGWGVSFSLMTCT